MQLILLFDLVRPVVDLEQLPPYHVTPAPPVLSALFVRYGEAEIHLILTLVPSPFYLLDKVRVIAPPRLHRAEDDVFYIQTAEVVSEDGFEVAEVVAADCWVAAPA